MHTFFHQIAIPLLITALVSSGLACSTEALDPSETSSINRSGNRIVFTDVTAEAGLAAFRHVNGAAGNKWYPEMMGSGGGFIDYDGDGWLDILLMGGGFWDDRRDPGYSALWLYRNNGDPGSGPGQAPTFTLTTDEAGLGKVEAYTIGLSVADYDNDGDQDFLLTNLNENMLFRNEGGVFTEVGAEAGLSDHDEWSSSALFFDADRDGWLDLYVGNYVPWSPETDKFCPPGGTVKLYCIPANYDGIPSRFYHNEGPGSGPGQAPRFTDKTGEAGFLPALGKSLGVVELDFDNDGWSDVAVANDGEGDLLYHNNGDGTFTEKGMISGFAFSEHGEARAGMGIDAGVVDSSGLTSIFVGNFSEEMAGVYRHGGSGLFTDRAAASRIGHASMLTLTFGLVLFDVDLDTDLDMFAANGHVYPDRLVDQDKITFRQRAQLYLNRGDGHFDEFIPEDGPLTRTMVARAAAYADYDRDGDLDILITENDGPAHLWRNDIEGARYLRVVLASREGNREALGARVVASVGGLQMERRIRTGSSYLAQSEKVATFGLGKAARVDSLVIYWPSGHVDRFVDVESNQELRIEEGTGAL